MVISKLVSYYDHVAVWKNKKVKDAKEDHDLEGFCKLAKESPSVCCQIELIQKLQAENKIGGTFEATECSSTILRTCCRMRN